MTALGQLRELLEAATAHLAALRELAEQGRHHGRALGPDSLLSASEVARELRWSEGECARWLREHVPVIAHPGSRATRLYRWADVLRALGARELAQAPEREADLPRRAGGARA